MDKAKEPNPGGSDQQNLGYNKLKNRKTDRTAGLNYCTECVHVTIAYTATMTSHEMLIPFNI